MSEIDRTEHGERSATGAVPGTQWRGRSAVAASILVVLLIGTFFAAAPGGLATPWAPWLLNSAILAVAFLIPALRIGAMADVGRRWPGLLLWALLWTAVWDAATSGILLQRGQEMFQQWWIIYPAGVAMLLALLLLHGAVVDRVVRRGAARPGDGPTVS
jgi:hypothetical protein